MDSLLTRGHLHKSLKHDLNENSRRDNARSDWDVKEERLHNKGLVNKAFNIPLATSTSGRFFEDLLPWRKHDQGYWIKLVYARLKLYSKPWRSLILGWRYQRAFNIVIPTFSNIVPELIFFRPCTAYNTGSDQNQAHLRTVERIHDSSNHSRLGRYFYKHLLLTYGSRERSMSRAHGLNVTFKVAIFYFLITPLKRRYFLNVTILFVFSLLTLLHNTCGQLLCKPESGPPWSMSLLEIVLRFV